MGLGWEGVQEEENTETAGPARLQLWASVDPSLTGIFWKVFGHGNFPEFLKGIL